MVPPALYKIECPAEIGGSRSDVLRRSSVVDVADYIQQTQMLCSRSSMTRSATLKALSAKRTHPTEPVITQYHRLSKPAQRVC